MVDRDARNQLLAAIDSYLLGQINSFRFEEQVEAVETNDKTVNDIAFETWFFYDDFIDHPVKLTREQWGYFQRLRLILVSHAEIKKHRYWVWSSRHTFALTSLIVFGVLAWVFGFGRELFVANIVIGAITCIIMSRCDSKGSRQFVDAYLTPFQSLGTMRDVRESVADFNKLRYPADMNLEPLRPQWRITSMWLPWLVLTPIILPFVLLKIRSSRRIIVP